MAKLEARLEANPQCKDVINSKTGALMPCPGSDKSFYRSAGLDQTVASSPNQRVDSGSNPVSQPENLSTQSSTPASKSTSAPPPMQSECKPQIHKKSGSMIPCPPTD